MNKTRVVNVKSGEPFDEYIGRSVPRRGLKASPLGNPFRVGLDGDGAAVLAKYRAHLLSRPDLLALLPALRGKVLACWCKPGLCHGDVIVDLLEGDLLTGEGDADSVDAYMDEGDFE
jgi:hypothetical protein